MFLFYLGIVTKMRQVSITISEFNNIIKQQQQQLKKAEHARQAAEGSLALMQAAL